MSPGFSYRSGRCFSGSLTALRAAALFCGALSAMAAGNARAQAGAAAGAAPKTTVIEFSVKAERAAANDMVSVTLAAEETGATAGEVARKVNGQVAEALKTARNYPSVKARSGNTGTYPSYAKNGKIDAWRMRSELLLEASDLPAISELLGKLQATLGVANLAQLPTPETRKKAEDEAILEAVAVFKARAKMLAETMDKPYRIKQMSVGVNGNYNPPRPMMRSVALAAEAQPMPLEVGESKIVASVSGQIELE